MKKILLAMLLAASGCAGFRAFVTDSPVGSLSGPCFPDGKCSFNLVCQRGKVSYSCQLPAPAPAPAPPTAKKPHGPCCNGRCR